MKTLIALSLMLAGHAHAQLRLDHPYPLGPSDVCYEASNDTQSIYCIPHELCRLGEVGYFQMDGIWQVQLSVGVCPSEVKHLNDLLVEKGATDKSIRFYRGVESQIDASRFNQISAQYRPQLKAVGDALNLYGPTLYVFQMNRVRRWFRDQTLEVLDELFKSDSTQYLGSIQYQFITLIGDEIHLSKSLIPIYTQKIAADSTQGKESLQIISEGPSYDLNSETQCWEKPQYNRICVK
jgi:hypothetical protein